MSGSGSSTDHSNMVIVASLLTSHTLALLLFHVLARVLCDYGSIHQIVEVGEDVVHQTMLQRVCQSLQGTTLSLGIIVYSL